MRITCNTISGLLSLKIEQRANDDSCEIIKEHQDACKEHRNTRKEHKAFRDFSVDYAISPLHKLKSTLRKKKLQIMIVLLMLIVVLGIVALSFLTAPEYIPYRKDNVSINEIGNRSVLVQFGEEVSGYDLDRYPSADNKASVYHLTTWDSIWNRSISKIHVDNLVLNPTGEAIVAVYYNEPDGREDLLIYGANQNPSGGVMTLPRLFLAYYARIALSLVVICMFLIILLRRHKKVTDLAIKILFLPVSYLIGLLLIKGMKTSSYHALRDFYVILLIMIPLYIALFFALSLYKTYRNKTIN